MLASLRLAALACLLFAGTALAAESWPARPVRIIIPFPPGTGDFVWRPVAEKLSQSLGQQFVLEHRPGAGGTLGTEAAVRSAPDGYTFLATPNSPITVAPSLRKLAYDWERDLVPVARTVDAIGTVAVNANAPAKTLAELLALARAKPEEITCGSAGIGTLGHMRCEVIALKGKAPIRHIPYRGIAEALNDVLAGHITMLPDAIAFPHAKAGKLRLLALFDDQRHPDFPDVPTIAEAGLPDHGTAIWYGVFAPKGVAREVVARLEAELGRIMADAELQQRLLATGLRVNFLGAATQAERMQKESAAMAQLVKDANIKLD
jgi:tripartite-type tricarboxylate transporter receptor subunit TctC